LLKEAIFHLFWAMRAKKRIREGLDIRRELLSAGQIGFAGDVGDGGAAKIGGDAGLDETLAHQASWGASFQLVKHAIDEIVLRDLSLPIAGAAWICD
jgi:hypothetical protein